MAVTIDSQPAGNSLNSPYRPLEITVSSNAGTINKMKCFIYLNGSGTANNASSPIILTPDFGTTDTFTFDISSYIAGLDTLTNTIQTKASALASTETANSVVRVQCDFTELLLSGGLLSDGASSSKTNTFYCINGVWQHDEVSTKFDAFDVGAASTDRFLTNNQNTRDIGSSESYYLSMFSTTGINNTTRIRLRLYTGKNFTGTESFKYKLYTLTTSRYDVACGTSNLAATTGWTDESGSAVADPTFDGTINSYRVDLVQGLSPNHTTAWSEAIGFNIDYGDTCEWTRIKFLNRLGAYEYFTFKAYKDRSINIRKQYYQDVLPTSYTVDQGGDRVLNIDSRNKFTLYSQPLKEVDRIWLEEMLDSLDAYVEEGSNYIPIKIRAGEIQIVNEGRDLMTIRMTYEYANPNRRQNG